MRLRLAIVGATGMTGREALLHHELLNQLRNQYATVTCVTGGSSSVGKLLGDVIKEKEEILAKRYHFWQPMECPPAFKGMVVEPTEAAQIAEKADYVISALPSSVAQRIEPQLRQYGLHIFSNASAFRQDASVPLIIPEVNPGSLRDIEIKNGYGVQVCNPNCVVAGFVIALRALDSKENPLEHIIISTRQSLSGKGDSIADENYAKKALQGPFDDWTYDGINEEALKICSEPKKILEWTTSSPLIEAKTTRVPMQYGHLLELTLSFREKKCVGECKELLGKFKPGAEVASLPSTPKTCFAIRDDIPHLEDLSFGDGMTVSLGDFRQRDQKTVSFQLLTHNLRRGATWTTRQCLELFLTYQGYEDHFGRQKEPVEVRI